MNVEEKTPEELWLEIERLRARLQEAEEALRAIRTGEVDALMASGPAGEQVFTLQGADRTYQLLIEEMQEGTLTLTADGTVLYCNRRLAEMLRTPLEKLIGSSLHGFVAPADREMFEALLLQASLGSVRGELSLRAGDGRLVPVHIAVNALQLDGAPIYGAVVMDLSEITALQRAQEETQQLLHQSERSRRALLSTLEDQQQAREQAQRLATKLKAIARPARQMSALLDVDELVQQVVQSLQEITGCYTASLFLREGDDGSTGLTTSLVLAAGHGGYEDGRAPLGYRLPLGQGIIGHVAESGQPLLVPDVTQDARYLAWEALPHTRSELAIPVKHGDRVLGVMDMQATEPNAFDAADLEALGVLADQLAVALENARLYEETNRRATEMTALYETALHLATVGGLKDLLQAVVSQAATLLQAMNVGIYLYDQAANELEWVVAYGIAERYIGTRLKPGEGLSGRVMQERRPMVVDDYQAWEGRSPQLEEQPVAAVAAVPLLWQDELIGVLHVSDNRAGRTFDDDDVRLLNLLAQPAAATIANARLLEAERRRSQELATVALVSAALRVAPTRDEMLPVILDQTLALLSADGVALAMRDQTSDETVIELAYGDWLCWSGERLSAGEGVSGHVIATGQPYVDNDMQVDPLFGLPDPSTALRQGSGQAVRRRLRAVACVPLIAQEQTIGALWLGRQAPFTEEEVRLLTSIADIAASAIHRATLHEQTQQRLERVQALRTIDMAITASLDARVTLNVILDQATAQLGVDAADVLLLDPQTLTLRYAAGRGFRTHALRHTRLRLGDGYAGQAAMERRIVSIPNLAEAENGLRRAPLLLGEGFIAYYAAPLISKGHVKGILEVFHHAPLEPNREWLDFLETLATQAAIAIDNAELFDNLQRANVDLTMAYDATLEGWARALELRDKETEGHSQRVTETTLRLARAMGMDGAALVHVRRGVLLHDIGKMGIPDSILLKPGSLTEEEWEIMRQHPVYAYQMLAPIAYLRPALDIPHSHHEKWDGSGYPEGLKGEQIPLAARVFALVDVWDALRSDRPYREAWSEERALDYIREQAGKHFDPQVVEVFLELVMGQRANELTRE